MSDLPPEFLPIPRLLESSQPQPRGSWLWYAMAMFALIVLLSTWAASKTPQLHALVNLLGGLSMLGVVVAMGLITSHAVRQQRQEQERVEAIEELIQLRRWDQAADMLDKLLAKPTRTPGARLQALIYLAGVLARYHRYTDAIAIQEYLLAHAQFDPGTAHGLKLMRTMAMLHADHLFDADRALADLRRESPDSAGVALIEIYRDVKTGHPEEAIEIFNARLPALRDQLGHRVADAYALVARAHDLLEQEADAAAHFERATLLTPAEELFRRYPEVATMKDRYAAAPVPREAA
jgi:tetratricopeptide (TPR) repeat protein